MRSGSRIRLEEDVRGCGHVAHCGSGERTRVPAATMKLPPPPPPGFREAESDSPPALKRLESENLHAENRIGAKDRVRVAEMGIERERDTR
ncbi:hypothetical protein RJT34_32628 [Clitoria ternatea]|uniref:Uncharacterized protein n=1 Tax=Clitoria ternatea TaxID=43366 RepID=A0AAN9I3Y8_CLITE